MKKKVAIICELKERELPFLSILQRKFELMGFEVRLISQRILCGIKILRFKPDYIFINGLRSDLNFVKQIAIPKQYLKSTIISFYTEQVGKDGGLAKSYNNPKIFNNVDYHITWSEGFAKGLIGLGVPKDKIWILGSMSLDIPKYLEDKKNELRSMLSSKYNLDKNKKWLLVADNIIRKNKEPHLYSKRRSEFNNCVLELADEFSGFEIIFRPHPDTKIKDFRDILKEYSTKHNVKFISEEHVIFWILQVEAVIIWRSTSAIESWLNGKEVLAFRTSDVESDYWHQDLVQNFSNSKDLIEGLKGLINGSLAINPTFIENRESYIKKWFYGVDGHVMDRISFLLSHIDKTKINSFHNFNLPMSLIYQAFKTEVMTYFAKALKRDFKRFNVSNKDYEVAIKNYSISKTDFREFYIKEEEHGNYILRK